MNSVQRRITLRTQSSAESATMKVRSLEAWTSATSGTTRGSEASPELIAWAVVTMPLWPSWRKMTESRVTGAPGRRDQVLEDVARADARELVGVADEQQVGPRGHGLEERRREAGVEHRGLVDDQEVGRERVGLVRRESRRRGRT